MVKGDILLSRELVGIFPLLSHCWNISPKIDLFIGWGTVIFLFTACIFMLLSFYQKLTHS